MLLSILPRLPGEPLALAASSAPCGPGPVPAAACLLGLKGLVPRGPPQGQPPPPLPALMGVAAPPTSFSALFSEGTLARSTLLTQPHGLAPPHLAKLSFKMPPSHAPVFLEVSLINVRRKDQHCSRTSPQRSEGSPTGRDTTCPPSLS